MVFGYLGLLLVGALVILRKPENAWFFILYMLGLTSILLFISWLKGEKLDQPEPK